MLFWVLDNLQLPDSRLFLVGHENCRKEVEKIAQPLNGLTHFVKDFTEGPACTCLELRDQINKDDGLLIAYCDQMVDRSMQSFISHCHKQAWDGGILVFEEPSRDPKWSYVRLGDGDDVVQVREKIPLSDWATVGIYYFRRGRDFVEAAEEMIAENDRAMGEFFVAPSFDYLIRRGKKIGAYRLKNHEMHGLGTPEDFESFIHARSER